MPDVYRTAAPEFSATVTQDIQTLYGYDWDERWAYTDEAGHEHRYGDATTPFPTLVEKSEPVPCDDPECGCDGYDRYWFECPLCDEVIRPRQRLRPYYVPGRVSYLVNDVSVSKEDYDRAVAAALAALPAQSPPPSAS